MSIACNVCQSFHGHNDEAHYDYYERELDKLNEKNNLLTEVIVAYAMDKPTVAMDAITRLMDMDNE